MPQGEAAADVAEPDPADDGSKTPVPSELAAVTEAASAAATPKPEISSSMQALVAASGTASEATEAALRRAHEKASSVTHKQAYDRFLRRAASKKHFKPSLSGQCGEVCLHPVRCGTRNGPFATKHTCAMGCERSAACAIITPPAAFVPRR